MKKETLLILNSIGILYLLNKERVDSLFSNIYSHFQNVNHENELSTIHEEITLLKSLHIKNRNEIKKVVLVLDNMNNITGCEVCTD